MDDLKQDHIDTANRLMALTLEGDSHEMLSAICRAIVPGAQFFGWTHGACEVLRDRLIRLICYTADDARLYYEEGFDAGFASADDWLAQHEDAMAEHGWVKLPVDGEAPSKQLADWIERRGLVTGPLDADGKLWHSGDMSDSNWGVIEGIAFENGRWLVSGHDTSAPWIPADSIRHHHEPTVEDVLEEFADRVCNSGHQWGLDAADTIAEFAAKLRLAGDAE